MRMLFFGLKFILYKLRLSGSNNTICSYAAVGIKQHNLFLDFLLGHFKRGFLKKRNRVEKIIDVNKITSLTTYLRSAVGALHPPRSWALNTFPHLLRYVLLLPGQLTMTTEKHIWKRQLDITDIALCNSNFVNFNFHNFIFAYQKLTNHWAVFLKKL